MPFGKVWLSDDLKNEVSSLLGQGLGADSLIGITNIFVNQGYGYIQAIGYLRREFNIPGFNIPTNIWANKYIQHRQWVTVERMGAEAKIPENYLLNRNYGTDAKYAYVMRTVYYDEEGNRILLNRVTMFSNEYLSPLEAENRASDYFTNTFGMNYQESASYTFENVFINGSI